MICILTKIDSLALRKAQPHISRAVIPSVSRGEAHCQYNTDLFLTYFS